jgi:hypothetical protein
MLESFSVTSALLCRSAAVVLFGDGDEIYKGFSLASDSTARIHGCVHHHSVVPTAITVLHVQ